MAHTRTVLLLPGQGGQYPRMAAGLYGREPIVTSAMDEVFALLGSFGDEIRADWLAAEPRVPLDHVTRSQILIFALDYAIGRLVMSWGIGPAAMLGHSVGEIAASTLAGVFTTADAVSLMRDRVEVLAPAPAGGMLGVAASAKQVAPFADGPVAVGAVNAPHRTVLAGPTQPLAIAAALLRGADFVARAVPATTPFHSPILRPWAAESLPLITKLPRRAPTLPLYSGYTGGLLSSNRLRSAEFWALQPAEPVYFWPALQTLLADLLTPEGDSVTLVEAGPGDILSASARAHPAVATGNVRIATLLPRRPRHPDAEIESVRAAEALLSAVDRPAMVSAKAEPLPSDFPAAL